MDLNSDDVAIFINEGDGAREGILLMENFDDVSAKVRRIANDTGAIKINERIQLDEDDDAEMKSELEKAHLDGVTVRAKLAGNLLALWDLDDSSLLTGRHHPPPPQFLFVLERAVAQLVEPTPTLPYAFSLTFPGDESCGVEQFRFSAFSEQDRTEWVQAIAACSHELLVARIRASADSVEELGEDEKELVDLARNFIEMGKEASTEDLIHKQALARAPPLVKSVAATSSSSSTASWSSGGRSGDLSPLEPDGDADAFSGLYGNCITKKLSLETGRGVIRVREDMAEPKVLLIVPPCLLDICLRDAEKAISHLSDVFYLPPKWESVRSLHLKRLKQFCDRLETLRKFLADYGGPPFKPSRLKDAPNMAPLPTNLHLQRFSVWDSTRAMWYSNDYFTSGCFTAYSEGFSDGGARRTRQKLRQHVSAIGANGNGAAVFAAVDYDFAKLTMWESELTDVGNRVEQLKFRLQKWAPKTVDELRNVGKFAAEVRTLAEQLRQLCDSIPRIQNVIAELASFYHSYQMSKRNESPIAGDAIDLSISRGEFSLETLETQREDFQAELACLITKVENLLQVDEATFAVSGADRDAWVNSFRVAADGVILRTEKFRRSILDGLFYGMLRALPTAESIAIHYGLLYRHVIILSQALTAVAAALLHELWMSDGDALQHRASCWSRCGALVFIHSYLSCYESENGMIEDMAEVTRLLREYCAFRVAKSFASVKNCASPIVEGEYGQFKVTLPVPDRVWMRLPETLRRGEWFYLVPAYWNVGINHAQTLASKLGGAALEAEVNEVAYKTLRGYVKRLSSCENSQATCEKARALLDQLCAMLCRNETKNVRLLESSTQLCQLLKGTLFISCKSGKDRTAMGVTLEEALVLQRDYGMPHSHFQSTLDAIRRDGTRLENTLKNIGDRQYAFTAFQLPFLPDWYRPPKGTHGKVQT